MKLGKWTRWAKTLKERGRAGEPPFGGPIPSTCPDRTLVPPSLPGPPRLRRQAHWQAVWLRYCPPPLWVLVVTP